MQANNQDEHEEFAESYREIKSDVKKVLITNFLILALLVGLFFANQRYGFLNIFFEWLKF